MCGVYRIYDLHYLFPFEILPSLFDLINFHSDTSLIALTRSNDHGSRFAIRLRDDSTVMAPLVTRKSSSLILSMSVIVSFYVLMSSCISSVLSIILFCLMVLGGFCIWTLVWCRLTVIIDLRDCECYENYFEERRLGRHIRRCLDGLMELPHWIGWCCMYENIWTCKYGVDYMFSSLIRVWYLFWVMVACY